jgi:hypothetical protein
MDKALRNDHIELAEFSIQVSAPQIGLHEFDPGQSFFGSGIQKICSIVMQVDRRHDGSSPCHTARLPAGGTGGVKSANHSALWLAYKTFNPPDGTAVKIIFALYGDVNPIARAGFELPVIVHIESTHIVPLQVLCTKTMEGEFLVRTACRRSQKSTRAGHSVFSKAVALTFDMSR